MDGQKMKSKKKMKSNQEQQEIGEDRISSLPDELIHSILSFCHVKLAVQTSVLSKRWKLVWTTLPYLNFTLHEDYIQSVFNSSDSEVKFFDKFLSNRNYDSDILELHLRFSSLLMPPSLFDKFLSYAIAHNVQQLYADADFWAYSGSAIKLSSFSSNSIKKLILCVGELLDFTDCWHLPALTTLDLDLSRPLFGKITIPESYLICLPCLQTLLLEGFELPESISLPSLTTLKLSKCNLPPKVWDFPALLTLTLRDVVFPRNMAEFYSALVNLRNLTLIFEVKPITDCVVICPRLVYLKIEACVRTCSHVKIMVLAPKLRTFTSVGFFKIKFGVSELDYVNIKLPGHLGRRTVAPSEETKQYYHRAAEMFPGLGSAKILTLDSQTIEALSAVSDFLARSPPPFYNLNYLKVPQGYKESSMSTYLRCYLLGRSLKATIVTKLPQENMIPHTEEASGTAQNAILQQSSAAPTKVFAGFKNMPKALCVDTLNMGVQKEHVMQNSVVNADSATPNGVPVVGTCNDRVSSSRGVSDFGLWRGLEVNSEFVCLLDLILNKYPETFEHFTTKNKKVCTMKLNMLCTSINDFTKISMTDVDTEMIAEYRDVFASLQKFGFNVSWLVSRLNYIEQLRFSQPLFPELHEIDRHIDAAKSKLQVLKISIDDTQTKLQDLHNLRSEKMQEIQKAFGTMGTNLVVGYIGDGLLSST